MRGDENVIFFYVNDETGNSHYTRCNLGQLIARVTSKGYLSG